LSAHLDGFIYINVYVAYTGLCIYIHIGIYIEVVCISDCIHRAEHIWHTLVYIIFYIYVFAEDSFALLYFASPELAAQVLERTSAVLFSNRSVALFRRAFIFTRHNIIVLIIRNPFMCQGFIYASVRKFMFSI